MVKIIFDILLSERAMQAVKHYDLNLPEVAVTAIKEEIMRRQTIDETTEEVNPTTQNNKLRLALYEARAEISRLKAMGYDQSAALKVMVRS